MSEVLARIVASTRARVAARQQACSMDSLLAGLAGPVRSLSRALGQPRARFILELKRGSPSAGVLRTSWEPVRLATGYAGVADAVSVVTEPEFFHGTIEDIAAVRRAVDVPILLKDFVLGPYQVAEARRYGADAVLLMLSVLDDAKLKDCLQLVERLGMEALVEVHDETELARAIALDASVIGINNRNLKTLDVDLGVTERLATRVPSDRLVVAESGVNAHRDVVRLAPHVDAFLVGSALMRAESPGLEARRLVFGAPVKICGLTNPEDAKAAREAGAMFGGAVVVGDSPRAVEHGRLGEVLDGALTKVAVFRNAPVEQVAGLAEEHRLDVVQLHGDEDARYVRELKARAPLVEVWKAVGVDADGRVGARVTEADRQLFDRVHSGTSGGTGRSFGWAAVPAAELKAGILAGGLSAENAAEARDTGAWALDASSGLEARPGKKDPARVRAFFTALRVSDRSEARHAR